ncbi:MAG: hypothetical protein ACTSSK_07585 [Candidatus Heimdallarchaeota archaeon]
MTFTNSTVISLIRGIGNNLMLDKSIERSLFDAISNLQNYDKEKELWIKELNLGSNYRELFRKFSEFTEDSSLSRIWLLLAKMVYLSSQKSGEKFIEIADNLEKNHKMTERRLSIMKAQNYKILFLGSVTSLFLGIIAGLAPLFAIFASVFREITISNLELTLITISLYVISEFSIYFLSDISLKKFNIKSLFLSSFIYFASYFIAKYILLAIM